MHKRVAIGDMVYLTNDREGIVRFKGKTGFGLGEWYGIELRTDHKTRHDGLIHGKRYFRCPRNKGLFVRKQIIKDVMDKKIAEQKTRVFKMGGTGRNVDRLNKKIQRKYQQQHPTTKKKTKPKKAKTEKKPTIKKDKTSPSSSPKAKTVSANTNITKSGSNKESKTQRDKDKLKDKDIDKDEDKSKDNSNDNDKDKIKDKEPSPSISKEKEDPIQATIFNEVTKDINKKTITKHKKKENKRSSIVEKKGDDTKYIKLSDFKTTTVTPKKSTSLSQNNKSDSMEINDAKDEEKDDEEKRDEDDIENETETETENEHDNETKDDDIDDAEYEQEQDLEDEERKDFSAKESFSNPKSRKYFGKDQIFTGLDRRRSKYEDILLLDPVANMTQQTRANNTNTASSTRTKIGTKRRKSYVSHFAPDFDQGFFIQIECKDEDTKSVHCFLYLWSTSNYIYCHIHIQAKKDMEKKAAREFQEERRNNHHHQAIKHNLH